MPLQLFPGILSPPVPRAAGDPISAIFEERPVPSVCGIRTTVHFERIQPCLNEESHYEPIIQVPLHSPILGELFGTSALGRSEERAIASSSIVFDVQSPEQFSCI
jgi:hypothetical protein